MTLEQAKQTRDKHKHLIGQRAKNADANIHDVIVVPVDNAGGFLSEYRMYMDDMNNDEMLLNYPSKSYAVNVIYDIDPDFVDIYSDDISLYIDRKS